MTDRGDVHFTDRPVGTDRQTDTLTATVRPTLRGSTVALREYCGILKARANHNHAYRTDIG